MVIVEYNIETVTRLFSTIFEYDTIHTKPQTVDWLCVRTIARYDVLLLCCLQYVILCMDLDKLIISESPKIHNAPPKNRYIFYYRGEMPS